MDIFTAIQANLLSPAVLFFVSFILLGTMIMLNLFIGIIMNSMSEMHAELDEQKQATQEASDQGTIIGDFHALDRQMETLKSQLDALRSKLTKSIP